MSESEHRYDPDIAEADKSAEVIPLRQADAEARAAIPLDGGLMPELQSYSDRTDELFWRAQADVAAEKSGLDPDPFEPKKEGGQNE